MANIEVTPLLVRGKDSEGVELEIDVAHMMATDKQMHATFARGLQEMLDKGFALDQSISVGFLISEVFNSGPAVVVFPEEHMETYLPDYGPADYIPPDSRSPA